MTNDGQFKPTPKDVALGQEQTPEISKYGQIALSIIDGAQIGMQRVIELDHALDTRDLNFLHHNYTSLNIEYPFSPVLNFGDLDDPERPCEITLLVISQNAGAGDRVPLSYGERIIFGKGMALDLLSKVKPGETAKIEGKGTYRVHSQTRTPDSEISHDPRVNFNRKNTVGLTLELELTNDAKKVVFRFSTRKTDRIFVAQELTFEKGVIPKISRALSSISRFGRNRK
ncbi:MAG TPA: hypothetical protein VMR81_07730 [Patescibacteria group bacterium]|nr:hypothetical protein [Patescibacteria group bacterium]